MKRTRGFFHHIIKNSEPVEIKSNMTPSIFESIFAEINRNSNVNPIKEIPALIILRLPDDMFIEFCTNKDNSVIGGLDAINEIKERMKQLGI